jgi:CelD/BcsL family acetyltransferase involved in cellulose biosynthesis
MTGLAHEIVADADALPALEGEWWDLWRRSPAATPFQSPAWLLAWLRAFRPQRPAALAVREGGHLVALAPGFLEDGAHGRRLLPLGIGLSDYADVLVDPAVPGAGAALLRAARELRGWDLWSLEDLPPGAAALELRVEGVLDRVEPQGACPVLVLPGGPDALARAVPGGKLRKLRMARNRSARREGFAVEAVGLDEIPAFLDALVALHGARWAERGEGGVLGDEAVRRFHALAAPALARAGLARFLVMRIEGRTVGAYYGLGDGRRAYAYLGGFDPAFGFESPGTVLIGHAVEAAAGEGAGEFHFLRGQEPYKYEWGAVDRWSLRRTLQRETADA